MDVQTDIQGVLPADFIAERDQFYTLIPQGTTVITECSDERAETPASAAAIAAAFPMALPTTEATVRVFGSQTGLAIAAMVSVYAAGGTLPDSLNSIPKMKAQVVKRMIDKGVIALSHSDAATEGHAAQFDYKDNRPVGCAFANLAGATIDLLVNNPVIREAAIAQQQRIFGNHNHTAALLSAEAALLQTGTEGKGGSFAISRADYANDPNPAIILEGKPHAPIDQTGVIFNVTDELSSSARANQAGKDFYSIDAKAAARELLSLFPELELDPQLVIEALALQAVPVRAALELIDSSHRGSPQDFNPTRLRLGVRGDIHTAVTDLRA